MRKKWLLWVRFYIELKQTVLNSWYVKTVGVRRGKNGHCPSVETGNKHQNFLENSTSAAQFRLIDVFLAMTVYFRYDTCTAQPDSLFWCQTVMSLPFIHVLCLQRQVTKFESGFFTVGLCATNLLKHWDSECWLRQAGTPENGGIAPSPFKRGKRGRDVFFVTVS